MQSPDYKLHTLYISSSFLRVFIFIYAITYQKQNMLMRQERNQDLNTMYPRYVHRQQC